MELGGHGFREVAWDDLEIAGHQRRRELRALLRQARDRLGVQPDGPVTYGWRDRSAGAGSPYPHRAALAPGHRRTAGCSWSATVELAGGDLDLRRARAPARRPIRRAGYAAGLGRLREFRHSADKRAGSTPMRALDEQLAVL